MGALGRESSFSGLLRLDVLLKFVQINIQIFWVASWFEMARLNSIFFGYFRLRMRQTLRVFYKEAGIRKQAGFFVGLRRFQILAVLGSDLAQRVFAGAAGRLLHSEEDTQSNGLSILSEGEQDRQSLFSILVFED